MKGGPNYCLCFELPDPIPGPGLAPGSPFPSAAPLSFEQPKQLCEDGGIPAATASTSLSSWLLAWNSSLALPDHPGAWASWPESDALFLL